MTTIGYRGRRLGRRRATLTLTVAEALLLREADALAGLEVRIRAGVREYRVGAGAWRPLASLQPEPAIADPVQPLQESTWRARPAHPDPAPASAVQNRSPHR